MPVDFDRAFTVLENDPFGRGFLQDSIYYMPDAMTIYSPTLADQVQPIQVPETALEEARRLAIVQVKADYETAVNAPLLFGDYSYLPSEISAAIDARTVLTNAVELTQTTIATGEIATEEFTDADFDTIANSMLTRNNPIRTSARGHVVNIQAATTVADIQSILENL